LQNAEVVEDTIASVKAYRKNSFNSKLAKMSTVDWSNALNSFDD